MISEQESFQLGSVVAIGGGHGQARLLSSVKAISRDLTAVVTVADDGGSSGRLRRDLGSIPPGDLRMCIAALSKEDSVLHKVLTYRFMEGDLAGHSLGNLILVGLSDMLGGMLPAIRAVAELMNLQGVVLPSAESPLELHAITERGHLCGQVEIHNARGIKRVWVEPGSVSASDEVVEAISLADVVVLGPGSLFTSVLAASVVPGVNAALKSSRALKILVCNLREQRNETMGMTLTDQIAVVIDHVGEIDLALLDDRFCAAGSLGPAEIGRTALRKAKLSTDDGRSHDPRLLSGELASAVMDIK